ncbi:MAG: indole-3-glycerol phosphate synthase TrpC [Candidatus Dadabacteria bacterium]|nr:indole-3-glycerol phosphate synthase TrpC [Candidatus Dadabacteria bacterium]
MILDEILQNKKIEIEGAKRSYPIELLASKLEKTKPPRNFFEAIKPDGSVRIIAEVKCASPSKGILRQDFNPIEIAKSYKKGGASAISVLTDRRYFKGDLSHLRDVRDTVSIPLLRKDFIIDPYQVYEARYYGADAVLLIAAALDTKTMKELLNLTHSLGMNAVVEVHNEEELEGALLARSEIIGINNRDLKTFTVSLNVSIRLCKLVPSGKVVVSESGLSSSEEIKRLKNEGIHVFLIGETFMKASDPGEELRALLAECNS